MRETMVELMVDGMRYGTSIRGREVPFGLSPTKHVQELAQHVERDGKLLFQEICERNLEGIVCKRKTSVYSEHGWLKIKNPRYTQSEGRREMFEAFREQTTTGKIRKMRQ